MNLPISTNKELSNKENNFEFSRLSAKELEEIIDFLSKNNGTIPSRIEELIVYGICANQIGEVCKKHFSGEVCSKEAFNMIREGLSSKIPPSIICEIKSYIQIAIASLSKGVAGSGKRRDSSSERNYHKKLVSNFESAFPEYRYVGSEVRPIGEDLDRIDILATCSKTLRDVIIELKIGDKSAHKQLRSYAYGFENPILINITERDVKNKRKGIIYKTFKDIGITL